MIQSVFIEFTFSVFSVGRFNLVLFSAAVIWFGLSLSFSESSCQ